MGLWILCEGSQRILEHPDRIPELMADAEALGATDLFVQVYRGGRAWYSSSFADATPYETIQAESGFDSLAKLIEAAHAKGLRVHAWVNVLALARNADAPIVQSLGRQAVHVDRMGRSILDYPGYEIPAPDRRYLRMGTPGVYLDPGAPGVRGYLVNTFTELVERYPELDGLHLDYIRYPDVLPFVPGSRFGVGLDFGYGEATRQRFQEETGLRAPFKDRLGNANRWDQWRRDQVTQLVREIRDAAQVLDPEFELSAAVWAYPDRGYLALYQDWRTWLEEDLIETAVPMMYSLDDVLFQHRVHDFAGSANAERIWVGLGSYLFSKHPERAVSQIQIVRQAGRLGFALFSWDSIVDAPALEQALRDEALANEAELAE